MKKKEIKKNEKLIRRGLKTESEVDP